MSEFPIYAALAKAQAMVQSVGVDAVNQHHKYKYTSAESLIREGRRALSANGLALIEQTCSHHFDDAGFTVALDIFYVLVHETGAMPVGPWTVPVMIGKGREADKAEAAARTYALGYTMRGLLMIDRPDDAADPAGVDQRDSQDEDPRPTGPRRQRYQERQQERPQERQEQQRGQRPADGKPGLDTVQTVGELRELVLAFVGGKNVSKWPKWPAYKTAMRAAAARLEAPEVADELIDQIVNQPPPTTKPKQADPDPGSVDDEGDQAARDALPDVGDR